MKLLRSFRVVIATILLSINSIIHVAPLLVVALIKAMRRIVHACRRGLMNAGRPRTKPSIDCWGRILLNNPRHGLQTPASGNLE